MAKRPASSRSKSTEAGAGEEPRPKRSRSTAADSAPPEEPAEKAAEQAPMGPSAEPTDEDIRRRAYDRYLARGGNHGLHFDDWLEAERELRNKK